MRDMIDRLEHGKSVWVNLKNPTHDEIIAVSADLGIPSELTGDLSAPVSKNYACEAEGMIKIVLDFPVLKRLDNHQGYEVKFFILPTALLTVHYEAMEGIESFKKKIEAAPIRKNARKPEGPELFFALMDELYTATMTRIDDLEDRLAAIEGAIFNDNEKEMVFEISNTGKKLITFRHTLEGQCDVLDDILLLFHETHPRKYENQLENIKNHYTLILRHAETLSQTLTALRDTNAAMLFTKQNEVMKLFTIMAFVTFPLTLLSSLFGMNTTSAPILGSGHDFWAIVGIMLIGAVALFSFFKYKKWIQ